MDSVLNLFHPVWKLISEVDNFLLNSLNTSFYLSESSLIWMSTYCLELRNLDAANFILQNSKSLFKCWEALNDHYNLFRFEKLKRAWNLAYILTKTCDKVTEFIAFLL